MTHDHDPSRDSETVDTGRPISALRDLEEPVSESFMGGLNRRIQRRLLAADMSRFTWNGPIQVVLEILSLIFLTGDSGPGEQKE